MKPDETKQTKWKFWVAGACFCAMGLSAVKCEPEKEFDYWQYVEWEQPEPHDAVDAGMENDAGIFYDAGTDSGEAEK